MLLKAETVQKPARTWSREVLEKLRAPSIKKASSEAKIVQTSKCSMSRK